MPPEITPAVGFGFGFFTSLSNSKTKFTKSFTHFPIGSHGILTDQYLLGATIRFVEVHSNETVVNHSAIHTRQAYGALVTKALPSAKACECVSENTSDEFVSFFQWWTLIRA